MILRRSLLKALAAVVTLPLAALKAKAAPDPSVPMTFKGHPIIQQKSLENPEPNFECYYFSEDGIWHGDGSPVIYGNVNI